MGSYAELSGASLGWAGLLMPGPDRLRVQWALEQVAGPKAGGGGGRGRARGGPQNRPVSPLPPCPEHPWLGDVRMDKRPIDLLVTPEHLPTDG